MALEEFLLSLSLVVLSVIAAFLLSCLVKGAFLATRDAITRFPNRNRTVGMLSPLLEIFKTGMKSPKHGGTVPVATRRIVAATWFISGILAFLLVPIGGYSFMPNFLGDFQLVLVLVLLMLYPLGLMVLYSISTRRNAIGNLKFISEDFLSVTLTEIFVVVSIFLVMGGSVDLDAFSLFSIQEIVGAQGPLPGLGIIGYARLFLVINPLAALAFIGVMPWLIDPILFTEGPVTRKWDPTMEFSGKTAGIVKISQVFRFGAIMLLFIDLFLGGLRFTSSWLMDLLIVMAVMFLLGISLAGVKARRKRWILDIKLGGFVRVHVVISACGLVLSIIQLLL